VFSSGEDHFLLLFVDLLSLLLCQGRKKLSPIFFAFLIPSLQVSNRWMEKAISEREMDRRKIIFEEGNCPCAHSISPASFQGRDQGLHALKAQGSLDL